MQYLLSFFQLFVLGNVDSIVVDFEYDNFLDDFNFGVLEDYGGGIDGVEGVLDVS